MKLNQIKENEDKGYSLTVRVGDYLTSSQRPSPTALKEISELKKYFMKKFLVKFNGKVVGKIENSQTGEASITIDFKTEADRVRAVKYIRQNINSDYVRNVKSH